MNYKIAVCDDSAPDRTFLSNLVKNWAQTHGHQVQLLEFVSAENFLFFYEEEKDFDILLLDIEMNGMDGVTMAKKIRWENQTVQIIFITGYSDYISEGYEVAALHYLMKPVKEEKLMDVLSRAAEKISRNEKVLYLEISGEMVILPVYQIRYAEVSGNYVTIHGLEDYTVKMALGNLTSIRRVTKKQVFLDDHTVLPLPRGAYDGINRAIIQMR